MELLLSCEDPAATWSCRFSNLTSLVRQHIFGDHLNEAAGVVAPMPQVAICVF